ncbi:MAG: PcfJ domain-containing protein [Paracoccaceae bacterium]|nr:PcfJ domain-containing protein [Paracoccaceae bacterium]
MLLISKSESKGTTLRYFCFIQPDEGDEDPRFDFISLSLNTMDFSLGGTLHIDIGLPVLQPQTLKISLPPHLVAEFNSQDRILNLLEFIAIGGLSMGTNLPVKIKDETDTAPADLIDDLDLNLNELLGIDNSQEEFLPISKQLAEHGLEANILHDVGSDFVIAENIEILMGELDTALESIGILRECHKSFNITLPKSFDKLNLKLVSDVLKLVPYPTAQTIWFYGNTDHPNHKYRIQAAQSYPLLAEYLLKIEQAVEAIDSGEPIQPIIAEVTGLNKGKLKRLTKMEIPISDDGLEDIRYVDNHPIEIQRTRRFALTNTLRIETILKALEKVDTGILPNSFNDWDRFLQITSGCALTLENRLGISLPELLNSSKGNWERFHQSLAQNANIPVEGFHLDHITFAASDALEAIDDFTRTIFLPRILLHIQEIGKPLPQPSTSDLLQASIASFNLLRGETTNLLGYLFNLGYRWSNRYPQLLQIVNPVKEKIPINKDFEEKRRNNAWPKLTNDFVASNDLVVRNLTSMASLKEESDRLDHCVGNLYVNSAKKGRCHIFSVQSPDGTTSFSTFEVRPPNTKDPILELNRVTVCQHKGRKNRVPPKKCTEALSQWVDEIKSGRLELNLEEVIDWKIEVNKRRDQDKFHRSGLLSPKIAWQRLLGENWDKPDIHLQLWHEWQNHLLSGKISKSSGSEILLESPITQNYLATFTPK